MIIIVTGTNTDVGKTIATAALACQYRDAGYGVEVVKPAQTGDDSDIRDVEKAQRGSWKGIRALPGTPRAQYRGAPSGHATARATRHRRADPTSRRR